MNKRPPIPKVPHAFFKWYCRPERYEEIHGDLEEFYYERAASNPRKARLLYVRDVIRCCQPYAWRKPARQSNSFLNMYGNYYKTSFRILRKNPLSSFINIVGLSLAIGIWVFAYGFADWVNRIDQFHENKDEVYLVTFFADRDGSLQQNGRTPRPLGEMLKNDFPEIKGVCRVDDNNVVMKSEDNVFHERVRFVDPTYLQMFSFPLKWGSAHSLQDLNSIILSDDMSTKYFGTENPVGKDIQMIFNGQRSKRFKITGVTEAFPEATSMIFYFLVNFENLRVADPAYDLDNWKESIRATLIQVPDPNDLKRVANGMEKYKLLQNAVEDDWAISSFAFEPIATLYERGGEIRDDISSNSYKNNFSSIVFLVVVAVFLLALACFNYINIAIVSAAKRLKEIGVRKAIGATEGKVIVQFLAENMFLTCIALLFGFAFGVFAAIPWFETVNNFTMDFEPWDFRLWIFLAAILFFTGFVSGIYPAVYISKFQVAKIFKGSATFGRQNMTSQVFLGFQLILACILITSAVMFTRNGTYLANRSWGYGQEDVLYMNVPDGQAFERLNAVMARDPNVLSISGSAHHLGKGHVTAVIHAPDREYEAHRFSVDANYLPTMGLKLKQGRFFQERSETDKQAVVVNEQLVKNMTLGDPIGVRFEIDSVRYEIVGVVFDFHAYNFSSQIQPTVFTLADEGDFRFISLRVRPEAQAETYQVLRDQWTELFPEIPFLGGYQEDVWGFYFQNIGVHGKVWRVIASVAILLATLGLYGLVTLNVSGRVREFSIRKVLGAGLKSITGNILNEYMLLFAVALLIGAPLSYVLIKWVFSFAYAYHMPVTSVSVVIAVIILVLVLLAVVSTQVRKVLVSSPVQGLKVE